MRIVDTIASMKNVKIAYVLSFLWRSWFWLGIWVFYYLRFTDYAGIGLLEAVMITTASLGEIPTGAIADVWGKKKGCNAGVSHKRSGESGDGICAKLYGAPGLGYYHDVWWSFLFWVA